MSDMCADVLTSSRMVTSEERKEAHGQTVQWSSQLGVSLLFCI
jgi:hypothetical protein